MSKSKVALKIKIISILTALVFFVVINHYLKASKAPIKQIAETPTLSTPTPTTTPTPVTAVVSTTVTVSPHDQPFLDTLKSEPTPDLSSLDVHQLSVPAYKQQYPRSCEESSLRMVLAYYGIQTGDMDIVKKVGYNPRPWDTKHNIWDDPNTMFVGNIDDPLKSGYGAFAPALAKAARTFGRSAQSYTLVSADFIATQIDQDHPVMVWGFFNSPPYVKYSWQTPQGKSVTAYRGEHVRVVVATLRAKDGTLVGFFLNDPLTGIGNEYWSANRLMKHMNMWGPLTNQVVVVQ